MSLHIADFIGNIKYIIEENEIGKGAFSTVYKGKCKNKEDFVAIKKIKFSCLNSYRKKIVENEILIHKKLDNKNIVKFIHVFHTVNNLYIVLEYCNFGTLTNFINFISQIEKENSWNQKIKYFYIYDIVVQIKNSIFYLYKKGYLHRDIKPDNILLSISGNEFTVKLSDFGFSLNYQSSENIEELCGSPLYMSPEILLYNKNSLKSDIWSLGCLIFEIYYGKNIYEWFTKSKPKNINKLKYFLRGKDFIKITNDKILNSEYINIFVLNELLQSCLVIDMEKRISWDNFFSHPFFPNVFNKNIFIESFSNDNFIKKSSSQTCCDKLQHNKNECLQNDTENLDFVML